MSQIKQVLIKLLMLLTLCPGLNESLIITSVLAGDKKFKTISFDTKLLKPLTFEKDIISTEFRHHRILRAPKFDIDVNIPIKLPLEEEYPKEEYKKPVESNFFLQTGEIYEPNYSYKKKGAKKGDQYAAASEQQNQHAEPAPPTSMLEQGLKLLPTLAKSIKFRPQIEYSHANKRQLDARSDEPSMQQRPVNQHMLQQQNMPAQESVAIQQRSGYSQPSYNKYEHQPDFIPGGFVNLKLSGPSGGPKATWEDYDREHWSKQLSETPGSMPYPILNYHQLQNYYGGLGTFTNGLAEQRYVELGLLAKIKSAFAQFTDKFHVG